MHGNIPAYAGKTNPHPSPVRWASEHPRVCGENWGIGMTWIFPDGTSPRMRGKLDTISGLIRRQRNIPAYAGKTAYKESDNDKFAEHPRVCGENKKMSGTGQDEIGTSPRMRGKPAIARFAQPHSRNIPAYAGKTVQRLRRLVPRGEHPRVCGENRFTQAGKAVCSGTSPRMRGKLFSPTAVM